VSQPLTRSTSSPKLVLGAVVPRLWTPPLRDLEDEESSWGYDFIDFCELIGWPLDPWQVWLAIHLGELYPDGSRATGRRSSWSPARTGRRSSPGC
jgi:hypothetical protein